MSKKTGAKRDVCQEITDAIIASLEEGVPPWQAPFDRSGVVDLPENAATGAQYSGINTLYLWATQHMQGYSSGRWMTFKQAQAAGGQVRKGEKGTPGIFYKTIEKDTGETDENGDAEKRTIPLIRNFTVFNLDQIDGLDDRREDSDRQPYEFQPIEAGEQLIAASDVALTIGGATPYYMPATDTINMPEADRFPNPEDYYAVYCHELTHATKHASRCNRQPYETKVQDGAYAFEELVAELGAMFTTSHIGLPQPVTNHDSYIANWLAVLKEDNRAIFKAAAQAQTACDWIITNLANHDAPEAA